MNIMNVYSQKNRGNKKILRKRIPAVEQSDLQHGERKPPWLKVKNLNSAEVVRLKDRLRSNRLNTVCEEAFCPNIGECFSSGTATFMILGDICTRRCSFCDVAHGRPTHPDPSEPLRLAENVEAMKLNYVVITSVDRDDLDDGGSTHFAKCISEIRKLGRLIKIEILIPDFKKCLDSAIDILGQQLPDVLNHNLETVPGLYRQVRPGADYAHSLRLLELFKDNHPDIPTKSGIMLGMGETLNEVIQVMKDLRQSGCDLMTIGQYLQPGKHHFPVQRYVSPDEFDYLREAGLQLGFRDVASAPLVRSSYHADLRSKGVL